MGMLRPPRIGKPPICLPPYLIDANHMHLDEARPVASSEGDDQIPHGDLRAQRDGGE